MSIPEPPAAGRRTARLPSGEEMLVLFGAEDIARRIDELAGAIVADLGRDFTAIALLKGSFVFLADLLRALHRAGAAPEVDFLTLSSYGAGTVGGRVRIRRDIAGDLTGRPVLIVDDIVESGRTLAYARKLLQRRGAGPVKTCLLLEKPGKRVIEAAADFLGFVAPDMFVVGYGMDLAHRYRELPFIGVPVASGHGPDEPHGAHSDRG